LNSSHKIDKQTKEIHSVFPRASQPLRRVVIAVKRRWNFRISLGLVVWNHLPVRIGSAAFLRRPVPVFCPDLSSGGFRNLRILKSLASVGLLSRFGCEDGKPLGAVALPCPLMRRQQLVFPMQRDSRFGTNSQADQR
jgi:hypothetical protein